MLTVREAKKLLENADEDAIVFVSSDEEGNSYRPAAISFPETMCDQDGEWVSVDPDDLKNGAYEGWEDSMVAAVVVW